MTGLKRFTDEQTVVGTRLLVGSAAGLVLGAMACHCVGGAVAGLILGFVAADPFTRSNPDWTRAELAKGIRHEMEHTNSSKVSQRIAIEHLRQHPDYYTRLERCFHDTSARR